jgi:hypothetical protein
MEYIFDVFNVLTAAVALASAVAAMTPTPQDAARWERLAWLVVTVVVTGAASVIVTQLG